MQSLRVICLAAGALFGACAAAQQIALTIDRIDGPSFSASKITGVLRGSNPAAFDLEIAEASIGGSAWRNVGIRCPELRQERDQLVCAQGMLESPAKIPLSFRYSTLTKNLDLALRPAAGEEWRLTLASHAASRTFALVVNNGLITRLAAWWPAGWPKPNAGNVSGKLVFSDERDAQAGAELAVANFGFGDASGLHAGEKIAAVLSLQAQRHGEQWRWQSKLTWRGGDVLWQPLFIGGSGHALSVAGILEAQRVAVERGRLVLAGIGEFDFNALYDRAAGKLSSASLKSANLDVAVLYDKLFKPALQGTVLADLRCEGRADIALEVKDGVLAAADLVLKRVSIEDKGRRFALFGLDGSLPWHRDQLTSAKLRLEGGEMLRVPFGAFDLPLETRGIRVRMRDVRIPILDGKLSVNDFATSGERESWRWRFSGAISPISMRQLTTALGLPVMHGLFSAVIPTVSYQQSTLKVDGALLFKVFDGTIVAQNLALESPLGKVPRLTADVDMRNLDLDLLTRTFSFGNITGRIDAQVKALELVNWGPVHFDARIASSAGDYPRRISQTAVQNISALGGAGAASAIQRSFLRFFETFGYSALGLSCKLEFGVCRMGGIENVPQGYVIVKGGGIPAINVMGYNRNVGWRELIERLKRVTEGNVIVK
ncbi:MAG: hypothetical protein HY525_00005 [Betaproteobacteria bacterium]|nr:hypothetical protein [Betaproteobacteria bacterium]